MIININNSTSYAEISDDFNYDGLCGVKNLIPKLPDMQDRNDIKRFLIAILLLPLNTIFCFTIPNCKVERFRKWYMLTFIMSISWLAVLSYFMVWMVNSIKQLSLNMFK
jgi:hypothetical protein